MTIVEDIRELLPYGYRTIVFFSLMSFIYSLPIIYPSPEDFDTPPDIPWISKVPIDWIRTLIIYIPTLICMWTGNRVTMFSYTLAIAHGLVHQIFPFINKAGINTDYTPAWDVLIHFLMLLHAVYLIGHFQSTQTEGFWIMVIARTIICGSILNVITSIFCSATNAIFVYSSIFQALSSGAWVFSHLLYTTKYNKFYLPIGVLTLAISMFNWFLFRANSAVLADAFINRYFEALFIIPTWIFGYLYESGPCD